MDQIDFLLHIPKLKELKRSGWVDRGVKNPESVADHSFMSAFIALITSPPEIRDRVVQLCIVHDFHESITGDMIDTTNWPRGGTISKEEKEKIELEAAQKLLPPKLFPLWKEYLDQETKEAKFAREVEKLDMLLQALHYKKAGNHKKYIDGFFDERNRAYLKSPNLIKIWDDALAGKENYIVKLFDIARNLKEEQRAWLGITGTKGRESIAGHSFGTAFGSLLLCPENLDKNKTIQLALLHDIGEAIIGDVLIDWKVNFPPYARNRKEFLKTNKYHGISKKEKERLEMETVRKIAELDPTGLIKKMFLEFENETSEESKFVKSIDRIELILQILYFREREGLDKEFNKKYFFGHVLEKVQNPELRELTRKIFERTGEITSLEEVNVKFLEMKKKTLEKP